LFVDDIIMGVDRLMMSSKNFKTYPNNDIIKQKPKT